MPYPLAGAVSYTQYSAGIAYWMFRLILHNRKLLLDLVIKYLETKSSVEAFVLEIRSATWKSPNELKSRYPSASIIGSGCVVFNINGNKYRAVAHINYSKSIMSIRWAESHKEYDKLDIKGTLCLKQN